MATRLPTKPQAPQGPTLKPAWQDGIKLGSGDNDNYVKALIMGGNLPDYYGYGATKAAQGPQAPTTGGGLTNPYPTGGGYTTGGGIGTGGGFTNGGSGFKTGSTPFPEFNYKSGGEEAKFDDIYQKATGGTINAYNTAANRLRERIDSATAANRNAGISRNLGRGFGNSGRTDADIFRANQGGTDAYAQGLNELSNMFESLRQSGLGIGLNAAKGQQDSTFKKNDLGFQDLSERRALGNSNDQFIDKLIADLTNSRENRASNEKIASEGNAAQAKINQDNNDLAAIIKQIEEQGLNWRTTYNNPVTAPPSITGSGIVNPGTNSNFGITTMPGFPKSKY